MNTKRVLPVFAIVAAMVLANCAAHQPLIVSGESLAQLGNTFVATAAAMDKALDDKVVTQDQYDKWATFGKKFQMSFPLAVRLWRVAKDSQDATLEQQAVAMVASMAADLAEFSALVGVK